MTLKPGQRAALFFRELVEGVPGEIGKLQDDSSYLVRVEGTTDKVYVRLYGDNNQTVEATNHKTAYRARLPVRVRRTGSKRYEVISTDPIPANEMLGESAAGANIPPVAEGSVFNFILPGENFKPGRCRPLTGIDLTYYVEPFTHEGMELGGNTGSLSTAVGAITAGQKVPIVISVHPTTNVLTETAGTEVSPVMPITRQTCAEVTIPAGNIRLWAYAMIDNDTTLPINTPTDQRSFDMRDWLGGGGGGVASPWEEIAGIVQLVNPGSNITIGDDIFYAKFAIISGSDNPVIIVRGFAGQTTNLIEVENSGGNNWFSIAGNGATEFNNAEGDDADLRLTSNSGGVVMFADVSTNRLGLGTASPNATLDVRGGVIINEDSVDVDVRIESNGDANNFFSDGGVDNIGMGTGTPDASAKLDIVSTTKGFAPPRMTTAQRVAIGTPIDGLLVYDSDIDALFLRANGAWVSLAPTAPGSASMTQVEVDFGSTPTRWKTFTVTDAAVGATSKLIAVQAGNAPTGKSADENEMDSFTLRCLPAAGSFTLIADCVTGTVVGNFKFNYLVAA